MGLGAVWTVTVSVDVCVRVCVPRGYFVFQLEGFYLDLRGPTKWIAQDCLRVAFPKQVQGRLGVGAQELASSCPYPIHRSVKPPLWAKTLLLLQGDRPILWTRHRYCYSDYTDEEMKSGS